MPHIYKYKAPGSKTVSSVHIKQREIYSNTILWGKDVLINKGYLGPQKQKKEKFLSPSQTLLPII